MNFVSIRFGIRTLGIYEDIVIKMMKFKKINCRIIRAAKHHGKNSYHGNFAEIIVVLCVNGIKFSVMKECRQGYGGRIISPNKDRSPQVKMKMTSERIPCGSEFSLTHTPHEQAAAGRFNPC